MAADASKKVVLVRKKVEAPKLEVAEPKAVELTSSSRQRSGPTEKQRARRRRQSEIWREAHPGLRYVQFVIDIELLGSIRCQLLCYAQAERRFRPYGP
jgi:hypothetical protein